MARTKYVVLENKSGLNLVLVFSERLTHAVIARAAIPEHPDYLPRSAGFVYFDDKTGLAVAQGGSTSLGLKSRPVDSEIISKHLGLIN